MKKTLKKTLAFCLSLVMLLSFCNFNESWIDLNGKAAFDSTYSDNETIANRINQALSAYTPGSSYFTKKR